MRVDVADPNPGKPSWDTKSSSAADSLRVPSLLDHLAGGDSA